MDYWQYIIPVVTTVLGYFFGRWNFDRARRATIHDRNIQEARDFVDFWASAINLVEFIERIFRQEKNIKAVNDNMLIYRDKIESIALKMMDMSSTRIEILNDEELLKLFTECSELIYPAFTRFALLADEVISEANTPENIDIKKFSLQEHRENLIQADRYIVRLRARLDKLATKIPK